MTSEIDRVRKLAKKVRDHMFDLKDFCPESLFNFFYNQRRYAYQDIRAAIQLAKGHYPL